MFLVGDGYFEYLFIDWFGLDGQVVVIEGYIVYCFDVIFEQVEQDLFDYDVVDDDFWQIFWDIDNDLCVGVLCFDVGEGVCFVDQFFDGNGQLDWIVFFYYVVYLVDDFVGLFGLFGGFLYGGEEVFEMVVVGLYVFDVVGVVVGDGRQWLVQFVGQ